MPIFPILIFIFVLIYMTPTIGLFVIWSNINLFDIDAISLSNNKFVSFDSMNFNSITKSAFIPSPFVINNLSKKFESNPHLVKSSTVILFIG